MDEQTRRDDNRRCAQGLVDELLEAEGAAQCGVDAAQAALTKALAQRAQARRDAKSEWLKWRGYGLAPLAWADGQTKP